MMSIIGTAMRGRAGSHVAHVMLFFFLLGASAAAIAQPPVLLTQPDPPRAGSAFSATLRIAISYAALGVGQNPAVQVNGNIIRIPFNTFCPFLCPPNQGTRDYTFGMPALAAGSYTVVFFDQGDPNAPAVAQVPLNVIAGAVQPASVPATGRFFLIMLAIMLVFAAGHRWRHARDH